MKEPISLNDRAPKDGMTAETWLPECLKRPCGSQGVLIVGVGGTGLEVLRLFERKLKETAYRDEASANIVSIVFDKDISGVMGDDCITGISLNTRGSWKHVREVVGSDAWEDVFAENNDMYTLDNGAINTRREGYMAFLYAMGICERRAAVDRILERICPCGIYGIDGGGIRLYIVASAAGNVGSGACTALALYIKRRMKEMYGERMPLESYAIVALPDVHETVVPCGEELRPKRANAYAFFRELSAMQNAAYGKADGASIHLGHRGSGGVGVLFDTQDPMFCTPDMAPFDRVFLQGKTEATSIFAHYEMMANTLYTLACTEAGREAQSRISAHQCRFIGPGKAYPFFTAIGSAGIEYPISEMLDHFAWRSVEEEWNAGWFFLHEQVEETLSRRVESHEGTGKEERISGEAYASAFLDAYHRAKGMPAAQSFMETLRENTVVAVEDANGRLLEINSLERYWLRLTDALRRMLPDEESYSPMCFDADLKEPSLFASRAQRESASGLICHAAMDANERLCGYYAATTQRIRSAHALSSKLLPTGKDAFSRREDPFSFVNQVLMLRGAPIHPVAALLQLCGLRLRVSAMCAELGDSEALYPDVGEAKLPTARLSCPEDPYELAREGGADPIKATRKSAYFSLGGKRFFEILTEEGKRLYRNKRTNYKNDLALLLLDAQKLLRDLGAHARDAFVLHALRGLVKPLDALILSYRAVFSAMAEAKDTLASEVLLAERAKSEARDGVSYYVGASRDVRRLHYERLTQELSQFCDVGCLEVGGEVFRAACDVMDRGSERVWRHRVLPILYFMQRERRALFHRFTDHEVLLRRKNVLEVIAEEASEGGAGDALLQCLRAADAMAKPMPSLKMEGCKELRFMIVPPAVETYFRDNAERFGARAADGLRVSADAWFPDGVVVRSENIPDNTVQLLRLSVPMTACELDEANENTPDGCYAEYLRVIEMANKHGREDLIPHLGRGWHLAGRLPYVVRTFEP